MTPISPGRHCRERTEPNARARTSRIRPPVSSDPKPILGPAARKRRSMQHNLTAAIVRDLLEGDGA